MSILVLNVGSSSIKFQLFDMPEKKVRLIGAIEKIGEEEGKMTVTGYDQGGQWKDLSSLAQQHISQPIADHEQAFPLLAKLLLHPELGIIERKEEIVAVGHRVVHGGETFSEPTLISEEVMETLTSVSFLAPLHNPANILGIEKATQFFPHAKQVAVFDTAFHQTLPEYAFRYAIPEELYQQHSIRVYGFHGTSHQYVSHTAAHYLHIGLNQFNAITLHLGNGCSMAAIRGGKSIDTSMGLTPLNGLVMGTRSGDIDPSLIFLLAEQLKMDLKDIHQLLNKQAGLKGLAGDNDMRNVIKRYQQNDPSAVLAIQLYVHRIRKYLGAYLLLLQRTDVIIFTAGVGEHSALIRAEVCKGLEPFGISIDEEKNNASVRGLREIQGAKSQIKVMVIPTNEELEIVNQMEKVL